MRKGFTLIELLVALSIFALVFSIGYSGFRDFARRQNVAAAGRDLRSDLRLAQQESLAGKKPAGCVILNGYNFRVTAGDTYTIEANCSGNNNIVVKTVTLTDSMSITTPSPNPIIFKSIGHGTNITSGNSVTVTIRNVSSDDSVAVTITSGGEIK